MKEDKAVKILSIAVPMAFAILFIGNIIVLITKVYLVLIIVLLMALIILLFCYAIGKTSFPEWNMKNPRFIV